jgi:hypothetical protein
MIIGIWVIVMVCLGGAAFGTSYVGLPRGMIHHAYVTYSDSNTVTIKPGYGECAGEYWEVTSNTNYDLTGLAAGEDFHYIYIDDSASSYPTPTFTDSNTEPTWSDTYLGWYNGFDRCIGVVWSPSSGATIQQFSSNSSDKYWMTSAHLKTPLTGATPDGTWKTLEATAYSPVNAIAISVEVTGSDSDGPVGIGIAAYESVNAALYEDSSYSWASTAGWLDLERGASRDLKWWGRNNDDSNFEVNIRGYQIER